jgi:hypothetical protein
MCFVIIPLENVGIGFKTEVPSLYYLMYWLTRTRTIFRRIPTVSMVWDFDGVNTYWYESQTSPASTIFFRFLGFTVPTHIVPLTINCIYYVC